MRQTILLDEMRERVAKLIFGDDLIGELTEEQYELLRTHGPAPRAIVRSNGSTHTLDHARRCPAGLGDKLDRAMGRWSRMVAQYVTAESWMQDHGLPVDPRRPADRKAFNAAVRAEAKTMTHAPVKRRPGKKPEILTRLVVAMTEDISSGRVPLHEFEALTEKELEFKYLAKKDRIRAARASVLASHKKQYRQSPTKNK
jgi:hypothetical protein